jgi:hypothetical protein
MREFYEDRNGGMFSNDDDDDEESGENQEEIIASGGIVDLANLDLIAIELNRKMMGMTLALAKQTWFWRFKSLNTKLEIIEKIYKTLNKLIITEDE